MISIDFETRSCTDLISEGLYNYARCPTTDVICMAYSVEGGDPDLWVPGMDVPIIPWGHDCYEISAWNAAFERQIWDNVLVPRYGFPELPMEHWLCSMYASRCNNLPAALGNAARCLNVEQQKYSRGKELIKLLSIPINSAGDFNEDTGLMWEMMDYCQQDVRTEMAVAELLRPPTNEEWQDYWANERVNDRGVRVDIDLAEAAQEYAAEEEADLIAQIEHVTDGVVTKARGEKLKEWVVERLTPEQESLLVKYKKGERKLSLDKYNRFRLLALDDIDPAVREVVECSDFAQRSSVGKFKAMGHLADYDDNRVRGALMARGASASMRYSSRGLQLHNMPRDSMDDPLEVRGDFIDNIMAEDIVDYYDKNMMTILSHMLRPALIPAPGCKFLVSDWSAIEGRVAPWLCKTSSGEQKLQLYRDNEPVYEITAAATFGIDVEDVTKDQRQIGKVQELSMQFGGGSKAFMAMARNYGLSVTEAEAEKYKAAWRRANPWAADKRLGIWDRIESAVKSAMASPGQQFAVGRLNYFCVEGILCGGLTLFCELPDGTVLTYPDVRIEMKEAPWGDLVPAITVLRAGFVPKASETEWPRTAIYGGLLFENAVQGTAASLLRYAVLECGEEPQYDEVQLPVVFHVHDELVLEVPEAELGDASEDLHDIMNHAPAWAKDLPLAADVDVMDRYGK